VKEELYVLPSSFGQQRLWLLEQIRPDVSLYSEAIGLRLHGPLDRPALAAAVTAVVHRHEVLHTVLRLDGTEIVQVVLALEPVQLPVVDVDGADEAMTEASRLAGSPFDLANGPLLRCHLLRLAPEDHLLVAAVHHTVCDGWSIGVVLRELTGHYSAAVSGSAIDLPELPVQYADYAAWQKQRWDAGELAGQVEYWRRHLAGASPLHLPAGHPHTGPAGPESVHAPVALPAAMVRQMRAVSSADVTAFMVALSAYVVVLARWSGQRSVVVGLPFAGRSPAELEQLVGFFVNTLPVRVDLSDDPGFLDVLGRIRESCLGAYQNAEVPFEMLVETLRPERRARRLPIAQAMLAVNNIPLPPSIEIGNLKVEPVELQQGHAQFDIMVDLAGADDALSGTVTLPADLFDRSTAELAARSLVSVLRAACVAPSTRVSELPCPVADHRSARAEPPEAATAPQPPENRLPTSAEVLLTRLWSEVLELNDVGIDDEFYLSGGNSMRAIRVVMRAREHGVELPVDLMLGEHTIREIAASI
jgi:Condensation domain/Phosphopantetheine attachment site